MPVTGFLKIPDVKGESATKGHEDEIAINGLSWGLGRAGLGGSGRARSRAEVDNLTVLKFYDAASPFLARAVHQGRGFDEIVITLRKDSGEAHLDYLQVTLTNCTIADYRMANGGTDDPLTDISEAVEIGFEAIAIRYIVQADDLSAGAEHEVEFDIEAEP